MIYGSPEALAAAILRLKTHEAVAGSRYDGDTDAQHDIPHCEVCCSSLDADADGLPTEYTVLFRSDQGERFRAARWSPSRLNTNM